MGKTYRYNEEKFGDNYQTFKRFKKEKKQKERDEEVEEKEDTKVSIHVN